MERKLQFLVQKCAEASLLDRVGVSNSDGNLLSSNDGDQQQRQSLVLPFQPYRYFPVQLPSRMLTDDTNLVCDCCALTTTGISVITSVLLLLASYCIIILFLTKIGRIRARIDRVPAWTDVVVPDSIPSYYFEMNFVDTGIEHGQINIGFFPADNRPLNNLPGIYIPLFLWIIDTWNIHKLVLLQVFFREV